MYEGVSGCGPDEIGSALIHILDILEELYRTVTILHLYSDSLSAQNKKKNV